MLTVLFANDILYLHCKCQYMNLEILTKGRWGHIKIFYAIIAIIEVIEPLKNFINYIFKKFKRFKKNNNYCKLKRKKEQHIILLLVIVCRQYR